MLSVLVPRRTTTHLHVGKDALVLFVFEKLNLFVYLIIQNAGKFAITL